MSFLKIFVYAIAVSLDGLGAGIAYGLKNIRIPFLSLLVIGLVTMVTMGLSIGVANWITMFISPRLAMALGAGVLICLGVWSILQEWLKQYLPEGTGVVRGTSPMHIKFDIGIFRLAVEVFKRPTEADMDRSGELSVGEALVLGMALAFDALVAGFGAALTGDISIWLVVTVGSVQMFLIAMGANIATTCSEVVQKHFPYLPGSIFILIGLLRFW
jgi:putative sporulation protein YtaF